MICETYNEYALVSFVTLEPTIVYGKKNTISIGKAHHDVTVINFASSRTGGQAILFFESVEEAKHFNRNVYPSMRDRLEVIMHLNLILVAIMYRHTSTATKWNTYLLDSWSGE